MSRRTVAELGQTEGSGLGLALVKRFVEPRGGRVARESQVRKRSRRTGTLPARPAATRAAPRMVHQ